MKEVNGKFVPVPDTKLSNDKDGNVVIPADELTDRQNITVTAYPHPDIHDTTPTSFSNSGYIGNDPLPNIEFVAVDVDQYDMKPSTKLRPLSDDDRSNDVTPALVIEGNAENDVLKNASEIIILATNKDTGKKYEFNGAYHFDMAQEEGYITFDDGKKVLTGDPEKDVNTYELSYKIIENNDDRNPDEDCKVTYLLDTVVKPMKAEGDIVIGDDAIYASKMFNLKDEFITKEKIYRIDVTYSKEGVKDEAESFVLKNVDGAGWSIDHDIKSSKLSSFENNILRFRPQTVDDKDKLKLEMKYYDELGNTVTYDPKVGDNAISRLRDDWNSTKPVNATGNNPGKQDNIFPVSDESDVYLIGLGDPNANVVNIPSQKTAKDKEEFNYTKGVTAEFLGGNDKIYFNASIGGNGNIGDVNDSNVGLFMGKGDDLMYVARDISANYNEPNRDGKTDLESYADGGNKWIRVYGGDKLKDNSSYGASTVPIVDEGNGVGKDILDIKYSFKGAYACLGKENEKDDDVMHVGSTSVHYGNESEGIMTSVIEMGGGNDSLITYGKQHTSVNNSAGISGNSFIRMSNDRYAGEGRYDFGKNEMVKPYSSNSQDAAERNVIVTGNIKSSSDAHPHIFGGAGQDVLFVGWKDDMHLDNDAENLNTRYNLGFKPEEWKNGTSRSIEGSISGGGAAVFLYEGDDIVHIGQSVENSAFGLGSGADKFIVKGSFTNTVVNMGEDSENDADYFEALTVSGSKSKIQMGGGDDVFNLSDYFSDAKLDMGSGNDTVHIKGQVSGKSASILMGSGDDVVIFDAVHKEATIDMGAGMDKVVSNYFVDKFWGVKQDGFNFNCFKNTEEFDVKGGFFKDTLSKDFLKNNATAEGGNKVVINSEQNGEIKLDKNSYELVDDNVTDLPGHSGVTYAKYEYKDGLGSDYSGMSLYIDKDLTSMF